MHVGSPQSSSGAALPPDLQIQAALAKKAQDHQKLEGEAAMDLIRAAAPPGTGTLVRDVA